MAAGLAAALVLLVTVEPAAPANLNLSCGGRATVGTQSLGLNFLAHGGVTTRSRYGSRREDGRVLFHMVDGAARMHLPSEMVTAVNGGGEDGWWPVTDLKVTDDVISGRLHLNIVNNPGVHIDRITGDIDVSGAYPFHGECEKASVEHKF